MDFYSQNFDALGRVKIKVDQAGTTVTMIYDLAGRLTEKQYHTGATPASDPAQTVVITQGPTLESTDTFAYDAASRITETVKGRHGITTSHTYAADSQPLTETVEADNRTYTMSRSYDAGNRLLTHVFQDGKATTWAYNNRNLVTNISYEGEAVLTQTHDSAYRLTNQTLGNGLTRVIQYNRQDNLRTSDQTFDGVQSLDDLAFSYTYAADKQITAENIVGDVIQNTSFTAQYDAGNRITNWTRDTNNNQSWNYDNAGNWSSTTVASTSSSISPSNTRNHSVSDQITSIAGNAAVHDAKGNLTEYEINTKQYNVNYDLDNRIIKVDVNNDDVEYRYDALGRQIIRKEGSTQTVLLWWGNSECAEYEHNAGQSTIQNDIMSHPSRLNAVIARAVDGSKFDLEWYHKNYLDHVYAVSDDTGNLDEHYRYTAFGEVTIYNSAGSIQATSQINNSILWNTRRLDSVSNYYLYKYRHYDPALGRWPSRDPIEENGGANLYAFVGNDALNRWDNLGMIPDEAIEAVASIQWFDDDGGTTDRPGIGQDDEWLISLSASEHVWCECGKVRTTKGEREDNNSEKKWWGTVVGSFKVETEIISDSEALLTFTSAVSTSGGTWVTDVMNGVASAAVLGGTAAVTGPFGVYLGPAAGIATDAVLGELTSIAGEGNGIWATTANLKCFNPDLELSTPKVLWGDNHGHTVRNTTGPSSRYSTSMNEEYVPQSRVWKFER